MDPSITETWTPENYLLAFDLFEAKCALCDHTAQRNGALQSWMLEAMRSKPLIELPRGEIISRLFAWRAQILRESGSPSL
ncbi:MAG TPA: hypothetical protein VMD75_01265 [Candidatus Binataceae bacterium]|nr:hypothetical protein [Candidatus Binataceae bacterium]